mmetsp:Transcript_31402/g.103088  ORF Transcript_31402/g.103088 Transcript_31402/m.103088 type:complete len:341 (+) Transcript_31402:645-1667(+)
MAESEPGRTRCEWRLRTAATKAARTAGSSAAASGFVGDGGGESTGASGLSTASAPLSPAARWYASQASARSAASAVRSFGGAQAGADATQTSVSLRTSVRYSSATDASVEQRNISRSSMPRTKCASKSWRFGSGGPAPESTGSHSPSARRRASRARNCVAAGRSMTFCAYTMSAVCRSQSASTPSARWPKSASMALADTVRSARFSSGTRGAMGTASPAVERGSSTDLGIAGDTVSSRLRRASASSSIQNLLKSYLCAAQKSASVTAKARIMAQRSASGSAVNAVPAATFCRDASASRVVQDAMVFFLLVCERRPQQRSCRRRAGDDPSLSEHRSPASRR